MQTPKSTIIIVLVLVAIVAIGFFYIGGLDDRSAARELAASPATKALGTKADTTNSPFTNLDGEPVALDQYLGQVLVVTSWASWSPFSGSELQLLAETTSEYAAQDVVVLAINRGEGVDTAQAYLQSIGVEDQVNLILDPDDTYYQTIAGYTMPETVFYNTRGAIVAHERGRLTQSQIAAHIETALSAD